MGKAFGIEKYNGLLSRESYLREINQFPLLTFRRSKITLSSHGKTHFIVRKESNMLWTIGVILLILWLLGFLGGYMIGGFIHLLLVIAIVVVLIRIIRGRRPL